MSDRLKTRKISRSFIQSRRYVDDEFFSLALDGACGPCEEILRAILGNPYIRVRNVQVQRYLSQLGEHAVRLDILAEDEQGALFNVEIQLLGDPDPKRSRYYGAAVDTSVLRKGTPYSELPDVYVIFIMGRDPFGLGESVYHIDSTVRETGEPFFDGRHILFANLEYNGDDAAGRLMHDLKCTTPADMYNTELAERMRFLKETPEGEAIVSDEMEQLIAERCQTMRQQMLKSEQEKTELTQKNTELTQENSELVQENTGLTQKNAELMRLLQEHGIEAPSFS